jgi:hypothetical protein
VGLSARAARWPQTGPARARSAGSGRAGSAARRAAASTADNSRHPLARRATKGGDSFDGNALGSAADGRGRICLVPVRGIADIARRGVHRIRFLPRVIQPRAGHRDHLDQPVPSALIGQPKKRSKKCSHQ